MGPLLLRWMITAFAVFSIPYLLSGVRVDGPGSALLAAVILGILNAVVRPLLIILTLPLTVFTLGFFILVINALLFQFAAAIVPGLHVDSFWSALAASIIVTLVSWLVNWLIEGGSGGRTTVVVRQWDDSTVDMQRDRDGKWK